MDPGTGKLYQVTDDQAARKRGLIPVNRELSRQERRLMRIGPNSPCGCGSGVKFKKCCRSSLQGTESHD